MSTLSELRTLLIDARIALRREMGHFEADPLSKRLETAIKQVTEEVMPPPSASTKTSAQQVALAWQTVCRGLKLTKPELYDEMSTRVMNLLNIKELVEPVTEILQLEEHVKKLESAQVPLHQRLADVRKKAVEAQNRLDELHKALGAAAPQVTDDGDAQALAKKRIDALVQEAQMPKSESAGSGARAASKTAAAPPPDGPIPSRAVLEAVVAGGKEFSKEQREWSVGECMALTSWEFTPVELIEHGDAWMAQKILDSGKAPA
jgi:hypothetical protein